MTDAFLISRSDIPRPAVPVHDTSAGDEVGGQWEWCWAVPCPYRVMAAPGSSLPMPAAPRQSGDFMDYLGYWATLQSLLTYSMGWSRHDKGLIWWYGVGCPTDDPRLALIGQVWGQDGRLPQYLAWCLEQAPTPGPLEPWLTSFDTQRGAPDTDIRELLSRARADRLWDDLTPYGKHLEMGDHIAGPSNRTQGDESAELQIYTGSAVPRAIFTCDDATGWYRALIETADSQLPPRPTSWRVEVHVRSIGYLGVYRRSRATGVWFSGRHRFHSVGN